MPSGNLLPAADKRVEVLARVPAPVRHPVGVQLAVGEVRRPHGGPVRPDAHRRAVGGVQSEVLARVPAPVRHPVGVQLVILEVRDPHGGPVRPDSGRVVVGGVQSEIAAGVPALGVDNPGDERQGRNYRQPDEHQWEGRRTPGGDHDLPPASPGQKWGYICASSPWTADPSATVRAVVPSAVSAA